jgi:pimeloyl-ACP methyl ester carboxylesterase
MRETVEIIERGEGVGPRILMLPGLGNRGAGFRPLARALAPWARPIIVEYPEGPYAAMGAEALALRVSETVGPVDGVLGSSFGGMVAGYLAANGRVRGAALVGSFTTLRQLGLRGFLLPLMGPIAIVPAPSVLLASIAARRFVPAVLAPDVVPTLAGERWGVWHMALAVSRQSPGVELRDLPIKCIALQGSGDLIVPPSTLGRLAASLPPGSRTTLIPGAGHVPYLTHVDECVAALRPWIEAL